MKITIQQRQSDGTNKKLVFEGKIVEVEGMVSLYNTSDFIVESEVEINSKTNLRIWIGE